MPGSIHELRCSGCQTVHKFETGTSYCLDHGTLWEYQQLICPSCQRLISRQSEHCCREQGPVCEICGGELERWSGRVWHECDPEGWVGAERVEGPCPACGTAITLADTTGRIGLWD
ncbi:MAG: hypothetical protein QOI10_1792 [Solirubrobacterales bacterium]|jgi:hypothetical protein|nr:hypothetical protein [Solirubrobacterales bacterium]